MSHSAAGWVVGRVGGLPESVVTHVTDIGRRVAARTDQRGFSDRVFHGREVRGALGGCVFGLLDDVAVFVEEVAVVVEVLDGVVGVGGEFGGVLGQDGDV
ncbi:hypothetical protein ACH4CE_38005, partial [Streptomyces gelaticus]|uniref:hypothetical protein n=1 Tax=Streptomyces gelaticus TaxID=285446 RepID=UPI0037964566